MYSGVSGTRGPTLHLGAPFLCALSRGFCSEMQSCLPTQRSRWPQGGRLVFPGAEKGRWGGGGGSRGNTGLDRASQLWLPQEQRQQLGDGSPLSLHQQKEAARRKVREEKARQARRAAIQVPACRSVPSQLTAAGSTPVPESKAVLLGDPRLLPSLALLPPSPWTLGLRAAWRKEGWAPGSSWARLLKVPPMAGAAAEASPGVRRP